MNLFCRKEKLERIKASFEQVASAIKELESQLRVIRENTERQCRQKCESFVDPAR